MLTKNLSKKRDCYTQIKTILEEARSNVVKKINVTMVKAYWHIGQTIVKEEQKGKHRANYGDYLMQKLSRKLTIEFGQGFDERNLFFMKQFYLTFPKVNALRSELSWTHYRLLLKVNSAKAINFYIDECAKSQWSTRQLERQINSFYFERLLSNKNKLSVKKDSKIKTKSLRTQPEDLIKDPYVLEFLHLKENSKYSEKNLEQALLDNIQQFLLELGRGFSLVARQKRISAEHEHFYIDLVLYNYELKCFVLIDLKIGKLTHQDIGQMDFYVRYFEKEIKSKTDNPTIGIILCSEKNEVIVKYSMLKKSKQLFASKYKLYLPSKKELKKELARKREYLETSIKAIEHAKN